MATMKVEQFGARPGFWAECSTRAAMTGDVLMLVESFEPVSAVRAVQWVHGAARELLAGLNPAECSRVMRWLYGSGCRVALDGLLDGTLFEFTVNCGRTSVVWTIRPVSYLPLAERTGLVLAGCTGRFADVSATAGRRFGGHRV